MVSLSWPGTGLSAVRLGGATTGVLTRLIEALASLVAGSQADSAMHREGRRPLLAVAEGGRDD